MRIQGQFTVDGVTYAVHRIELKGFTRIEICEAESVFQIDVGKVLYGYIRRKTEMSYGNKDLFDKYMLTKSTLTEMSVEVHSDVKWEDGRFLKTITKMVSDECYVQETKANGLFDNSVFVLGATQIIEVCVDADFNVKMDPQNIGQYVKTGFAREAFATQIASGDVVPLDLLKQRFDLSWENICDYEVLETPESARAYIAELKKLPAGTLIGFDFETTQLEFNCFEKGEVVGIVISHAHDQSRYLPFAHEDYNNLPIEIMHELFKEIWDYNKVAHNKKFERKVLIAIGYRYFPIKHDSLQASIVENPVLQSGTHALKTLGTEIVGREYMELEDIFPDKSKINFAKIKDMRLVKLYACPDADTCRKVLEVKLADMPVYSRGIYDMEAALADIKAEQEYWGFRVDYEPFIKDYEECSKTREMLEQLIKKSTRTEIKLSSGDQLSQLLYGKFKCPVLVRTKTGKPSTGAKALKKLARETRQETSEAITKDIYHANGDVLIKASDLNKSKYPTILLINAYKDLYKLEKAFFVRFETKSINGRYFSWVNQNGARSGRQSSPMHQLPKKMKARILPDSEDHVIVDADYSQVELRILASYAGETKLMEAMRDSGKDIHRVVAEIITGVEMWAISSEMRQIRKATNFGVVYQISPKGLAEQIYGVGVTKKQIEDCATAIQEFYQTFKRIKQFNDDTVRHVGKHKNVYTKFNRPRPFERLDEEGLARDLKASMFRQAINTPIQGTAADIMKLAEINLNAYIREKGWDKLVSTPQGTFPLVRIMISAHDEVVLSVHKSIVKKVHEVLKMIKECMEIQVEDWVPLFTGTCIVDNWAEGKSDAYQIGIDLRDKIVEEATLELGDDPKRDMLKVINDYRDNELRTFMEALIEKAGTETDAEAISKLVRHPTMTHELIGRFEGAIKKQIAQHGSMTHIESITFAVSQYLEWRKEDRVEEKIREVKQEPPSTEYERYLEELNTSTEELYSFDENGNIIDYSGEETFETVEDEYDVWSEEEEESFRAAYLDESVLVYELFNRIVCDATMLSKAECDELLKILKGYEEEDGFSEICILWENELIDTGIKCESIDKEKVAAWLLAMKKGDKIEV